jgi:hypothetical protein
MPQCLSARRQLSGMSYSNMPSLKLTFGDGGTTASVVLTRHQLHQPMRSMHSIGSQRTRKEAQPTSRQRRLEPRLGAISGTRRKIRKTLDRPLRVCARHASTTLQLRMARPDVRGRGRATPTGHRMAHKKHLLQPPVAFATQPRPEASTKRRRGYNSRPHMDIQGLVPCAYRNGLCEVLLWLG